MKGNVEEVASKVDLDGLESWARVSKFDGLTKCKGVEGARINLGIVRGLDYYSGVVFEAFDQSDRALGRWLVEEGTIGSRKHLGEEILEPQGLREE